MHWLDGILAFIAGQSAVSIGATITATLEFVARAWPTSKAVSLVIPIQYALKGLSQVTLWLAGILDPVVMTLNNVTAPAPAAPQAQTQPTPPKAG